MNSQGGEQMLLEPVEKARQGVARGVEKVLWGAFALATKVKSWMQRTGDKDAGQEPVITAAGGRRSAGSGQPTGGSQPTGSEPKNKRSSGGPEKSSGGPERSSGGPEKSSGGPERSSGGPEKSSGGPEPAGADQPTGSEPRKARTSGSPNTSRGADRTPHTEARTPIVPRIERNPRTNDATAASHVMLSLKAIKDPKLQEKALQNMDVKQLRLLNRHANHIGEAGAKHAPDAVTRRACNAVHETTKKRIGDMSNWSRNPADRIPTTAERNNRLISDVARSGSPKTYVRDSTPKERAALKNALTRETTSPRGWGKKLVAESLETVRAADGPRPTGYAAPGKSGGASRTPAVVRGADRAVGGTKKLETSRVAALAR